MTLCGQMIKGLCKLMGGSQVTNLPCLVAIGLVQVGIQTIRVFKISSDLTKPRDWRII